MSFQSKLIHHQQLSTLSTYFSVLSTPEQHKDTYPLCILFFKICGDLHRVTAFPAALALAEHRACQEQFHTFPKKGKDIALSHSLTWHVS